MRLDHLLSKELRSRRVTALVGLRPTSRKPVVLAQGGDPLEPPRRQPGGLQESERTLVEHWLFGLSASSGRFSTAAHAAGTTAGGVRRPSTLLGPEGTAAGGPLGQDRW